MYLPGHTHPSLTMPVNQQVIDMRAGGVQTLERAIGCTIAEASTLLSGRGVLAPNRHPSEKRPPSSADGVSGKAQRDGLDTATLRSG
jgi:hypothetical protein